MAKSDREDEPEVIETAELAAARAEVMAEALEDLANRSFDKRERYRPHRPTLNAETADKIIAHLRVGAFMEQAAAAAGVHRVTVHWWLRKGADGTEPYATFADRVHRALAEGELRMLAIIDKAALRDVWQAAAWKLERKWPQRWAQAQKHELSGKDGAPLRVEGGISAETADAVRARVLGIKVPAPKLTEGTEPPPEEPED